MARPKAKAPSRRYHISGQSVVTIGGRDFYLGKHDSPESLARYAVLIGAYQQNGLQLPEDFELDQVEHNVQVLLGNAGHIASEPKAALVKHVTELYRQRMRDKYPGEDQAQDRHRADRLCKQLDDFAGNMPAEQFGPLKLREFRDTLAVNEHGRKQSRSYVNRLTKLVLTMFRHAISFEMVSENVIIRLETVPSIKYGESKAPERDKRQAAEIDHVRATAKHLSPVIKAMLRIQIATGMRPKELCSMRPCDIDRSGEVWVYKPATHKTAWTGKDKLIPIVGDAREALTEYLQRPAESFCFSPKEAMAWRHAWQAANRKTPLNCGNRPGTNRVDNPQKQPGNQYDAGSYRKAIQAAAKKAGVPKWHPYQLRHLAAKEINQALGIQGAKALLGHSTAAMTEHYAGQNVKAAIEAANAAPKL